jgi:uncharacterized caspase-like protein
MGLPGVALAQKRVALVVGNSAYKHTGELPNPKNDATDVAAALNKHGFKVLEGYDLDKAAFDRKIRDFANELTGAETGVFFYAGHGLSVDGRNYLVPTDAELATPVGLDSKGWADGDCCTQSGLDPACGGEKGQAVSSRSGL